MTSSTALDEIRRHLAYSIDLDPTGHEERIHAAPNRNAATFAIAQELIDAYTRELADKIRRELLAASSNAERAVYHLREQHKQRSEQDERLWTATRQHIERLEAENRDLRRRHDLLSRWADKITSAAQDNPEQP